MILRAVRCYLCYGESPVTGTESRDSVLRRRTPAAGGDHPFRAHGEGARLSPAGSPISLARRRPSTVADVVPIGGIRRRLTPSHMRNAARTVLTFRDRCCRAWRAVSVGGGHSVASRSVRSGMADRQPDSQQGDCLKSGGARSCVAQNRSGPRVPPAIARSATRSRLQSRHGEDRVRSAKRRRHRSRT